jgi:hypothetical protein
MEGGVKGDQVAGVAVGDVPLSSFLSSIGVPVAVDGLDLVLRGPCGLDREVAVVLHGPPVVHRRDVHQVDVDAGVPGRADHVLVRRRRVRATVNSVRRGLRRR